MESDDLEHASLPLGQAVAVRAAVGERADGGRLAACGGVTAALRPPDDPLFSANVASSSAARAAPLVRRTNGSAPTRPIKHMFEVETCPVAFVGPVR